MTTPAEATPARSWGWAAGIVLIAMAIASFALAILSYGSSYGFSIIFIPIAAVQLVTGVSVMLDGLFARVMGIVVAVFGIAIGLTFTPSFFVPVSSSEYGSTWPLLRQVLVVSVVPYVFVIVGLVLGSLHLQRQP